MENEIKVGEYIRSDLGSIGKVTRIEDNTTTKFYYEDKELITIDKRVVKHSPNLIDLIECGDLVKIKDNCGAIHWFEVYENSEIYQYDILEIATKEMMESISYQVERNN